MRPYHQLRDLSPFKYVDLPAGSVSGIQGPLRSWALMKFSDVYDALRDHETFSSSRSAVVKAFAPLPMVFDDPPRHTRFRRLVNKAFTLKRVQALTPGLPMLRASFQIRLARALRKFWQRAANEFDIEPIKDWPDASALGTAALVPPGRLAEAVVAFRTTLFSAVSGYGGVSVSGLRGLDNARP